MLYILKVDVADAWKCLVRQPLRSFLSSLGIAIGVAAIVAMLSISEGAKRRVVMTIDSLGMSTLRIEPLGTSAADGANSGKLTGITQDDLELVSTWLGGRGSAAGYVKQEGVEIGLKTRIQVATVVGITPLWQLAEDIYREAGRNLVQADFDNQENNCLMGNELAVRLGTRPPVQIRYGGRAATVVGLLHQKGRLLTEGTGLSALDFDNSLFCPVATVPYTRVVGGRELLDGMVVTLNIVKEQQILSLAGQVNQLLITNHRGVRDINLVVPVKLLRDAKEKQRIFSVIMVTIAGLSLIVGGIGIMNMMLANIAEQTREIGLRMVLGASRARIVGFYLLGAMVLTLSGSFFGVLSGIVLSYLIQFFVGWDVAISLPGLVVAPGTAILVGLLFGSHPAFTAASLQPAEALRQV
ncbi:ABC transporter permease [Desulforhopalus singaporensis]|uniref:Putative ABC transport system permease protein n=1 Tax=Desulforhopalus singaporensis TaxID=91360 RepID=A0A1H0JZU6_9BACT|nr:ABC transporter permease [Desulforhopalus singaporensis]SDO49120.1 putative ABC transport system permease protein [Desulforhopalus singaporensis]